jgi:hypothetical protein
MPSYLSHALYSLQRFLPPERRVLKMNALRLLPLARPAHRVLSTQHATRSLSARASRVLSALDLPTDGSLIPGMYDGQWGGSGAVQKSTCPATGEVIGHVQTVSLLSATPKRADTPGYCRGDSASYTKYERSFHYASEDARTAAWGGDASNQGGSWSQDGGFGGSCHSRDGQDQE